MYLGRMNDLPVIATGDEGVVLGTRDDFVLLPPGVAPEDTRRGDRLRVFVVNDDAGVPKASLKQPAGLVGDIVVLTIVELTEHGAFADWGMDKDLLIPANKQHTPLRQGQQAVVGIDLGPRGRCFGSTWIGPFLDLDPVGYSRGRGVDFLVYGRNDLGVLGVVDGKFSGLILWDEFGSAPGNTTLLPAFVLRVLDDGRMDCSLRAPGAVGRRTDQQVVLDAIAAADGRLPLTDRSSPDAIRDALGLSKKAFKRAVGALYKKRMIVLEDDAIVSVGKG
ncbi:MAG: putative RNA-binding protein (virulence factor B family) [Myxococcota bacterium]|jgi:predicted RNA-binding protein (virulence factor B family)